MLSFSIYVINIFVCCSFTITSFILIVIRCGILTEGLGILGTCLIQIEVFSVNDGMWNRALLIHWTLSLRIN
jgi:hypothetical protein